MADVPTLCVCEYLHMQKIQELCNLINELLPQTVIMINNNTNITEENIENISNMQKVIKKEKLL